jgi:cytochrome P450
MDFEAELEDLLARPSFLSDPYATYRRLRENRPVYRSEVWGAWVLTRYDDIQAVFRDSRRFSNAGRFTRFLASLPAEAGDAAAIIRASYAVGMLQSDPPDHTRMRALVNKAFTPRVVEGMRPRIQQIVEGLLVEADRNGGMDVIGDLAYPLPAIVIAEMLGVPPEDSGLFITWSDQIVSFQGSGRAQADNARTTARALDEFEAYFRGLCDRRRQQPADDLLSALVTAEEQGDRLTNAELVSMGVTLLIAGHETTRNLIGNAVYTLLRHDSELARLRQDPGLLPLAIEEVLRYESPIQRGWRRVAEDVELRGQQMKRDDLVFMMIGAANRDPDVFLEPDDFNIGRKENRHVAFGLGVHFCLGAPLARLEGPIAVGEIMLRDPRLTKAPDEYEWTSSILLRGIRSLPIEFARGPSMTS